MQIHGEGMSEDGNALRGQAFFQRQVRRMAHVRRVGVAAGAVGHALYWCVLGLCEQGPLVIVVDEFASLAEAGRLRGCRLRGQRQRQEWLALPGQPPLGPASGAQHRHACLRALALLPDAGAAHG